MAITFEGFDQFSSKLQGLPAIVIDEIDKKCGAAAKFWEDLAIGSAPVKTGRLRSSISSDQLSLLNWEVKATAPYAGYVEGLAGQRVAVPNELATLSRRSHPFFFIHQNAVESKWLEDLNKILNTEH